MGKSRILEESPAARLDGRGLALLALCLAAGQLSACRQAPSEPVDEQEPQLSAPAVRDSRAFAGWLWSEEVGTRFLIGKRMVGSCELLCGERETGTILWSAPVCPSELDLVFASDDCRAAIVLWANPVIADQGPEATVLAEVLRDGKRVAVNHGRSLLGSAQVAPGARRLSWIAGALGRSGNPPRRTADGKGIELEVVGGGHWYLGFDGTVPPEAMSEGPAAGSAPRRRGMLSYVDESGNVVFVADESEIPPQLRRTARPLEAQVTVTESAGLARDERRLEEERRAADASSIAGSLAAHQAAFQQQLDLAKRLNERAEEQKRKASTPIITLPQQSPEPPRGRTGSSVTYTDKIPACQWAGGACKTGSGCCSGSCARGRCQ